MKIPEMSEEDVQEYLEFLLRQYRLIDALWFLAVEDTLGTAAAVKLNEQVWAPMGRLAAREIKERFSLEEEGIARMLEALTYYPWYHLVPHEMEETADRGRIRVSHCPPQEARVDAGRAEFACKARNLAELTNFAREIDERLEVRCLMAPPDPHPEDLWCEWELTLREST
jgi:hypothetical protein